MASKPKPIPPITIETAKIIFRNFTGLEGQFNAAGKRNFCVLIDHELAEILSKDGWNVKYPKPREDEEEARLPFLKVQVSYKNTPPKIIIINNKRKTHLDEDSVGILDWAEIESSDLIIVPYRWDKAGKTGISAYIKTMYVTLKVDELELKYRDVPEDSALSAIQDD